MMHRQGSVGLSVQWFGQLAIAFGFLSGCFGYAEDCVTMKRNPVENLQWSATVVKEGAPAQLYEGEGCPWDPEKCKAIGEVKGGESVSPVHRQNGFTCVHVGHVSERKGGWVRNEDLEVECEYPRITDDARLEVARVVHAKAPIDFLTGKTCPRTDAACKKTGDLKPGTTVFLVARRNEFACVQVTRDSWMESGWVKADALALVYPKPVRAKDWPGRYRSENDGVIDIAEAENGAFAVSGGIHVASGHGPGFEVVSFEQVGLEKAALNLETLTVGRIRRVDIDFRMGKTDKTWQKSFDSGQPRLGCSLLMRRLEGLLVVKETPDCRDDNGHGIGFEGVWVLDPSERPVPSDMFVEGLLKDRSGPH